jgi:hypothetical protein
MRPSLFVVSLVIFVLLQNNVQAKCLSYNDGDAYPSDNSSYCRNFINYQVNILQWDVSESTLTTYSARDAEALSNYTTFYNNYYKLGLVDIDCLGMANYFFCAKAYPTCDSSHDQIEYFSIYILVQFVLGCASYSQFDAEQIINFTKQYANMEHKVHKLVLFRTTFLYQL